LFPQTVGLHASAHTSLFGNSQLPSLFQPFPWHWHTHFSVLFKSLASSVLIQCRLSVYSPCKPSLSPILFVISNLPCVLKLSVIVNILVIGLFLQFRPQKSNFSVVKMAEKRHFYLVLPWKCTFWFLSVSSNYICEAVMKFHPHIFPFTFCKKINWCRLMLHDFSATCLIVNI
jgi:hypothetical protein